MAVVRYIVDDIDQALHRDGGPWSGAVAGRPGSTRLGIRCRARHLLGPAGPQAQVEDSSGHSIEIFPSGETD